MSDSVYERALRNEALTAEEYATLTPEQRRALRWGGCPPEQKEQAEVE